MNESFAQVAVEAIVPSPYQQRVVRDEDLAELATSIAAVGVVEPIIVRPSDPGPLPYELVAGHRRWRASVLAGRTDVPAIIRDYSDDDAEVVCVVENLQRADLAPLEEATGVEVLLRRRSGDVEAVAAELGRTPAWVAQRARIADGLDPAWLEAAADPDRVASELGAGHLAVVARLTPELQLGVLEEVESRYRYRHLDQGPPTIAWLREIVARRTLRLSAAPWKLKDAELVPAAGACSTCPKRSGASPLLWEEDGAAPADDRCLDSRCWSEKLAAHLEARHEALRAEHGKALVLASDRGGSREKTGLAAKARSIYEFDTGKKKAAGAVPILVVDGEQAGRLLWGVERPSWQPSSAKPAGPRSLAERRALLERRRHKLAIERVAERLDEVERLPPALTVARLVASVGTNSRQDFIAEGGGYGYSQLDPERHVDVELRKRAAKAAGGASSWGIVDAYDLVEDLEERERLLAADLWAMVLPTFRSRLRYDSNRDTRRQWYEAERLAALVGIDAAEILAAAVAELPEPKSWAKLKADGKPRTEPPKARPRKTKKAKKTTEATADA